MCMEENIPFVHGTNGRLRFFFEFTDLFRHFQKVSVFFRAIRVQKAMKLNAYKC